MFNKYYNETAIKLLDWSLNENDRIKASKILKISDRLEAIYRYKHKVHKKIYAKVYTLSKELKNPLVGGIGESDVKECCKCKQN